GTYTFTVRVTDAAGAQVSETFTLKVQDRPLSAGNTTATVGDGIAGQPTSITITVRNDQNDPVPGVDPSHLDVTIGGANADAALDGFVDNGDGTYTVSYTPTVAGSDEIAITLDGVAISGSPYTSSVEPGPISVGADGSELSVDKTSVIANGVSAAT